MSKNILFLLFKILAIAFLIFIGLLYFTLRTKINDVSTQKPFNSLLNQTVITKREAILAKNESAYVNENDYIIIEDSTEIYADITEKYTIPIGTELKIEKAKIFTNGISGFSHLYVLGTIYVLELQKHIPFEYNYGEQNISLYEVEKEYWSFDTAVWEDKNIKGKFYFE